MPHASRVSVTVPGFWSSESCKIWSWFSGGGGSGQRENKVDRPRHKGQNAEKELKDPEGFLEEVALGQKLLWVGFV